MKHWYQKPHPSLVNYVRTVLILEGFSEPAEGARPVFTNGMPALLCQTTCRPGQKFSMQLTLFGKSIPEEGCDEANTTRIAYFFKPFAVAALFNLSASALARKPVDLGHKHSGALDAALIEQLDCAISTTQRIDIIDRLLIHCLAENKDKCDMIRFATDALMLDSGVAGLTHVLHELKLTERTFQRMFKKYVGITANQYRRICQFQTSFAQVRAGKFNTLADVAYDNGFADQSHFIRSFREFTRVTPHSYLKKGLKE